MSFFPGSCREDGEVFRRKREQRSLLSAMTLRPEAKRLRLERSWASVFREKALPQIDEEKFRTR